MVLIIPICKNLRVSIVVLALVGMAPAFGDANANSEMDRYVDARMAEIGNQDVLALKGYLSLFKKQADSPVLADRLFAAAIRAGDMESALRAVRAQELRNQATPEAPLLLYADAYRRKNWSMANVAASELEAHSNYAFMAPILRAWVNVAQKKPSGLAKTNPQTDPYIAYFSLDQRVYLDLASGDIATAKSGLSGLSGLDDEFARDLAIRAAPIFAANGDRAFAATLLQNSVERDYGIALVQTEKNAALAKISGEEGLAALHIRVARALLEQKNSEKALIFARVAQWLAPESDSTKLVLAQALKDQSLPTHAQKILDSITPESPYWPRAVADHVRSLLASKNSAEAINLAQSAASSRPNSANSALVLAQAYEETGDLKSAIAAYTNLVGEADTARATPQQRSLYRLFLATVQDKSGDWATARKVLEEAKGIDPKNPFILNYLGYGLLERREDVAQALDYIRAAHELAPQSTAIADSLGWAYFLSGDYDRAVPLLENAAKVSGNDMTINEHLGDAYWLSGRFVDARYAWSMAAQTAENTDSLRLAGKIDLGLDHVTKIE